MQPNSKAMKSHLNRLASAASVALAAAAVSGCETTGTNSSYQGYGSIHDPWYYGDYYDNPDLIVLPPGDRVDRPHPSHPIANPPSMAPRPMPAMRGGGGRRR